MKKVTVIFTDDTRGKFDCKNVSYDRQKAWNRRIKVEGNEK